MLLHTDHVPPPLQPKSQRGTNISKHAVQSQRGFKKLLRLIDCFTVSHAPELASPRSAVHVQSHQWRTAFSHHSCDVMKQVYSQYWWPAHWIIWKHLFGPRWFNTVLPMLDLFESAGKDYEPEPLSWYYMINNMHNHAYKRHHYRDEIHYSRQTASN